LLFLFGVQAPADQQALRFPTPVYELRGGIFLVAGKSLLDPNFARSVIFITAHDQSGSIGLIVNRPTPVTVASALPSIAALQNREDPIRLGGPVQVQSIRLLVRSQAEIENGTKLIEEVYYVSSIAALDHLLDGSNQPRPINFYAGYAGWGPGQLAAEFRRGDWHLIEADAATIFDTDPDRVWHDLIQFLSGRWVIHHWPAMPGPG
jgi:putative transcriptional regulator